MALYTEDQYGTLLYGSDTAQTDSGTAGKKEYYTDLEKYVPDWLCEYKEMDATLRVQGYEIGRLWHNLDDYFAQTYVGSATWGLSRWEKILGITVNEQMSLDSRRQQIKARLIAAAGCTLERLRTLAEAVTGTDVLVTEDNPNYSFTIFFVGKYGVPNNIRILQEQVERIKPAHLQCIYKYRYVIWNELKDKTWADLTDYTWDAIRVNQKLPYVSWASMVNAGFTVKSIKKYTWNSIKEAQS